MNFRVNYKGIQKYIGKLEQANAYLTKYWGSVARAHEFGVKLELVRQGLTCAVKLPMRPRHARVSPRLAHRRRKKGCDPLTAPSAARSGS